MFALCGYALAAVFAIAFRDPFFIVLLASWPQVRNERSWPELPKKTSFALKAVTVFIAFDVPIDLLIHSMYAVRQVPFWIVWFVAHQQYVQPTNKKRVARVHTVPSTV